MATASPTVYVVDDDDSVRESLRALLETFGLTVKEFESGADFLAHVEAGGSGCVVLDVHLPGVSGLETLIRLRSKFGDELPVVMITGQTDRGLKEQLLARGASAYIEKPFDALALVETVNSLARRGEARI
ncbi:MAG TPA: response regulator [Stellaceae bacterium]|nr:response regulator [Stellaceae bacterium]